MYNEIFMRLLIILLALFVTIPLGMILIINQCFLVSKNRPCVPKLNYRLHYYCSLVFLISVFLSPLIFITFSTTNGLSSYIMANNYNRIYQSIAHLVDRLIPIYSGFTVILTLICLLPFITCSYCFVSTSKHLYYSKV